MDIHTAPTLHENRQGVPEALFVTVPMNGGAADWVIVCGRKF